MSNEDTEGNPIGSHIVPTQMAVLLTLIPLESYKLEPAGIEPVDDCYSALEHKGCPAWRDGPAAARALVRALLRPNLPPWRS